MAFRLSLEYPWAMGIFNFIVVSGAFFLNSATADVFPGRLATRLSPSDVTLEQRDLVRYPKLMAFIQTIKPSQGIRPTEPENRAIMPSTHYFEPTQAMWDKFFTLAAEEKITVLRAFALISREIKKQGAIMMGPGEAFEKAVRDNRIDLGLALPAHNIGTATWVPNPANTDPEFQLHLTVYYTEPFVHQFPDNILPANLKVGFGPQMTYVMHGKTYSQHTVEADIFYGPTKGIGFRNVKGVGGQKRGVLGFFQKVFFFLPDAVDSMAIDEKRGTMVTEALINTTVANFETDPKYAIHRKPDGEL